jgi:hypothetical protein
MQINSSRKNANPGHTSTPINTLARLATISSTVQCECPRHPVKLLTSLAAFEQYSTMCESRSIKDVALPAYLNATASRARHMIVITPTRVLEAGPTCC